MMRPPPGREYIAAAAVVWRPSLALSDSSPAAAASRPSSALTSVDLPPPDWPAITEQCALSRRLSRQRRFPLSALTGTTSKPAASYSRRRTGFLRLRSILFHTIRPTAFDPAAAHSKRSISS